jgi:nicotinamidase-related amidase
LTNNGRYAIVYTDRKTTSICILILRLIKNKHKKGIIIMKVLIGIDLQNDFIDGALGSPEAQAIVPRVVDKLNNIKDKNNTLLLLTKDTHYSDYLDTLEGTILPIPHCVENTQGWSINKDISEAASHPDFLKYSSKKIIKSRIYKNTFGSDDLRDLLIKEKDNIESVEFIGLCTDICVISNVLMARQALPDTPIYVDASCCAGVTPEKHDAALEVMKSCQIEII